MRLLLLLASLQFICGAEPVFVSNKDVQKHVNTERGSVIPPHDEFQVVASTDYSLGFLDVTNLEEIQNATKLLNVILEGVRQSGMKVLSSGMYQFVGKGEGATAYAIFYQGHIVIHTWPEYRYAAVDIHVHRINENRAKRIQKAIQMLLGATVHTDAFVPRGIPNKGLFNQNFRAPSFSIDDGTIPVSEMKLDEMYSKRLSDIDLEVIFANFRIEWDILESEQTQYQQIEFIRNTGNGDVCLSLDSVTQICESYNKHYSEVYVHLPVSYLKKFETALIIGGGDALALAEVLKYKSVKRVVQLELDIRVAKLSEKYLGVNAHLPDNPDADPRVEWIFGDAVQTIVDLVEAKETFDIILLDISETDPSGTVSTVDFFRHVSRALAPNGIFVKNEHYQEAASELFNNFLEIRYPVPVIGQQVFVLGSNGTSLYKPAFQVSDENGIETTYLAHGPSDNYRQFDSMVRRYSKRTFRADNTLPIVKNMCSGDQDVTCDATEKQHSKMLTPCGIESAHDPVVVPLSNWRTAECMVPVPNTKINVTILNRSPERFLLGVEPSMLLSNDPVETGDSVTFEVEYNRLLTVLDDALHAPLGRFTITTQQATHPYIAFFGLQEDIVAALSLDGLKMYLVNQPMI